MRLDAAALRRPAAVVRDRRHVGDARDLDAERIQRAHSGFATGAGPLDPHLEVLDAAVDRRLAGLLGRDLRRERRRLARALEARAAGRRPRERVALAVGDRDDRVVEGRVDVRDAFGDVLLDLLARARGGLRLLRLRGHAWAVLALFGRRRRAGGLARLARTFSRARIRARALAAHRQAAAMTHAAVAAEIHQPLDVHRHLAAE